jgi:hypothetical protein
LLPEHDEAVWSPGDGRVLPEPVLGAAVPLLLEADPYTSDFFGRARAPSLRRRSRQRRADRFTIDFFDRAQPRSTFTLSWWIKRDSKPTTERLAEQSWDPTAPATAATAEPDRPLISIAMVRERSKRTRVEVKVGADRLAETVDLDTPSTLEIPQDAPVDSEDWHHLAVTFNGPARTLSLFLDGAQVATVPVSSPHLDYVERPRVVIDGDAGGGKIFWLGPVRLFDRAHPEAELLAERHHDRATYPTIDQRHPLAFRLADDCDEPVMYATDEDIAGRTLHLVLENRSRFPVELPRWRLGADIKQFLELRFRPGCLVGGAHYWVEPHSSAWHVESSEWTDGGTSLFVGRISPLTLNPGQSAALTLHHVRADGTLGAHGSHVELVYTHPHHPELLSTRVSPAEVRGQRGRRSSPLRFAVLGNQVLVNDGRINQLRLSIINTSQTHPVSFTPPIRGSGSRLTLSIDGGTSEHSWALATYNQLREAVVSIDDGPGPWQVETEILGENPQWTLSPTRAQTLEPGETMTILIENLHTTMALGHSRAELRLENIAGYWDDDLRVEIKKSRLVEDAGDGNALDVEGNLKVAATLFDRYGELLPGGVIVMWHGSETDVPDGWVLCNGENGTPDLTDRFIRASAAPSGTAANREGGGDRVKLTVDNLPFHRHRVPGGPKTVTGEALGNEHDLPSPAPGVVSKHAHEVDVPIQVLGTENPIGLPLPEQKVIRVPTSRHVSNLSDQVRELSQWVVNRKARLSTQSIWDAEGPTRASRHVEVGPTGGGQSFDNRPAFYELCFIMKRL